MSIPRQAFDVPLTLGDIDCVASVRVTSYVKGSGPRLYGDAPDPGWPAEVEWEIETIRHDYEQAPRILCPKELAELLRRSDIIREACLEAIDDHNQPPEV